MLITKTSEWLLYQFSRQGASNAENAFMSCILNSYPPRQNGRHFGRRHFQMKIVEFQLKFTEICSQESNWQKASIALGNGLAPNRRQAITWTNDAPVHRRIYAALKGDGLNSSNGKYAGHMLPCVPIDKLEGYISQFNPNYYLSEFVHNIPQELCTSVLICGIVSLAKVDLIH